MNAVIYARYSSAAQGEASIEGQLDACYKYAKDNRHTVIEEYIDRANTGKNDNRHYLQKLLADSKKGQFEIVIVYQFDRFARNRYDSAINKHLLGKNGVRVISATESISDDPSGRLVEGILETYAEYFSEDLKQKVTRGHENKAKFHLYNGGPVPLGYKIDFDHKFQLDEKTSPIVKKVFKDFADGKRIVDIVNELNLSGLRTFKNTLFTENSFRTLLKNRRYLGIYIYKDIVHEGGIPRIVDDTTFKKVQDRLEANRISPVSKDKYILTMKLFCGHCKDMMTGISGYSRNGQLYSYYSCRQHQLKHCDKSNVSKEYIEDLVIDECRKVLTEENIYKISKEVAAICEVDSNMSFIKQLRSQLLTNATAISNLLRALEQGKAAATILSRIEELEENNKKIEAQIAKEEMQKFVLTEPEIRFFLTKLRSGDINTLKNRKALVSIFVNRIYLYDDKLSIIFNTSNKPVEITSKLLAKVEGNSGSCERMIGVPYLRAFEFQRLFFNFQIITSHY